VRYQSMLAIAMLVVSCKTETPAAVTVTQDSGTKQEEVTKDTKDTKDIKAVVAGPAADVSELLSKYPGTDKGAKQLLTDLRLASDAVAMTRALKPTSADYKAVFGDSASQAEAHYEKGWNDPEIKIGAKPENTELLFWKATSEELQSWVGDAATSFPGGYKEVASKYQPGLTVYRWKYAKPGETLGMAYDGLIYVNNHWAWFPKPWRMLAEK
jgi:hypothetical protein